MQSKKMIASVWISNTMMARQRSIIHANGTDTIIPTNKSKLLRDSGLLFPLAPRRSDKRWKDGNATSLSASGCPFYCCCSKEYEDCPSEKKKKTLRRKKGKWLRKVGVGGSCFRASLRASGRIARSLREKNKGVGVLLQGTTPGSHVYGPGLNLYSKRK